MSPVRPFRCFNPRVLVVALISAAATLLLAWWGKRLESGSTLRVLAALGQAAAYAWLLVELAASIRRLDELEQRIHVEAAAFGALALVGLITGWGFLEHAGLPRADWGMCALIVLTLVWGLGVAVITRRYR